MQRVFVGIVVFFLTMVLIGYIWNTTVRPKFEIVYDCYDVDVDTGFPIEVRDRCARLKKQLERN